MKKYDIIVIGSGGGAKITSPASKLGLKVACIEKDQLGGTCLNRGCIPSKMLIHPADIANTLQEAKKFDINNDPHFTVNFEKLITRINNTVNHDSNSIVAGYNKNPNIDYYKGTAKFLNNTIIEVNKEQLTADKIFIAVGARPMIPNIEGLEKTPYMTSTEALTNTQLPKTMIVIGAGYIALEIGYAYSALGCDVEFIVRSQYIRNQDADIVNEFSRVFSKHHKTHFQANPKKVTYTDNKFTLTYINDDNTTQTLTADALLMATGICSNADTLNLDQTDIKTDAKGFIKVNNFMQTDVSHIWAIGDCVGNYFFRHSVNFEGEYLFDEIFAKKRNLPIKYPPIPFAVFTNPQIAGVGMTEDQVRKENINYVVGINFYDQSAMGMALLSDHGFCKIIIEKKTRRILGAHIIGPEASNMIHMVIAFMNKQGTLDDLLNMIYIHPALPEIVRNAARKANTKLKMEKPLEKVIKNTLEW